MAHKCSCRETAVLQIARLQTTCNNRPDTDVSVFAEVEERRRVRLSVKLACCERDGEIAAALFADFKNILGSRFPRAMIAGRQYDSDMHAPDPDENDMRGRDLIDMG